MHDKRLDIHGRPICAQQPNDERIHGGAETPNQNKTLPAVVCRYLFGGFRITTMSLTDLKYAKEENKKLRSKIKVLEREIECAWGLIANAGTSLGHWETMPQEWQDCAARWRDRYFAEPNDKAKP